MNKHEQFIHDKCVEANPEIVELKFGCRLKYKDKTGRWRDDFAKFRHQEGEIYADVWDDFYGKSLWPIDEIEILGREITLFDCILAIKKRARNIGWLPILTEFYSSMMDIEPEGIGGRKQRYYSKTLYYFIIENWENAPLSGQSDETKKLIAKILGFTN